MLHEMRVQKKGLAMNWSTLITCPNCGSTDLVGQGIGEEIPMPNPEDEDSALVGYAVVEFCCQDCRHQWVDDDQSTVSSKSSSVSGSSVQMSLL